MIRSKAYREWIAEFDCAWCGAKGLSHAAHFGAGGTSLKTDDYRCIPLCPKCHIGEYHQKGFLGHMTHNQTHDWANKRIIDFLILWIEHG